MANEGSFLCKRCSTEIVSMEFFVGFHSPEQPRINVGPLFLPATLGGKLTVRRADETWRAGPHTVKNVFCVGCGRLLGFKCVTVSNEQTLLRKNLVHLRLDKLFFLHGNLLQTGEAALMIHLEDHFMCKLCTSEIAIADDIEYFENGMNIAEMAVFIAADNIEIDDPPLFKVDATGTYARIHCRECLSYLGWKQVLTANGVAINGIVKVERVRMWQTIDNLIVQ